jgi:hypothetical protein
MKSKGLLVDRVLLLKQMDLYVLKHVDNEYMIKYWLLYGVPDESDMDDLFEIAEDNELFLDVINAFNYCTKRK